MAELGKIEKPSVQSYSGKKKLYCVPNIYPLEKAPDEYKRIFDQYWDEADKYLDRLEVAGKISRIFCELIYESGDVALEKLEKINSRSAQIIRKKMDGGAAFFPLEDREIFGSYMDWSNCLRIISTKEVFQKVIEFYKDIMQKRTSHILDVIEKNLLEGEAGLLIMRDDERAQLQFPKEIDVFLVTPPSYDEVMRWIREKIKES
jgi:hypothetical protein